LLILNLGNKSGNNDIENVLRKSEVWHQRLRLDEILAGAGFGRKTRILTQIMILNRLIEPCSELAMSDWVRRSALEDSLKEKFQPTKRGSALSEYGPALRQAGADRSCP
jgi:hypothetical protein